MFGYNDSLDIADRCRVFNIHVTHALANNEITNTLTPKQNCLLFSYRFSNDKFECLGAMDLCKLKDAFLRADEEVGENHYDRFMDSLQLGSENGKINICVFQFSPHELFSPSMYVFNDEDIKNWMEPTLGECPASTPYNAWFSNKILKSMLDWAKVGPYLIDPIFKNTTPEQEEWVVLHVKNENRKETNSYLVSIDTIIKLFEPVLIGRDLLELIGEEYNKVYKQEKTKLMIFCVTNYLKDYLLLVHY